jgi:indolepyruvate ferredoxin oxidoreductase, alpha subunit
MLELRIRACHVHGRFVAKDNQRPAFTLKDALEHPRRDVSRIVLPPASFLHEQEKIEQRWPAAVRFIEEHGLNEFFDGDATTSASSCRAACTTPCCARSSCWAGRRSAQPRAAVRDERRLSAGRRRGAALLRRQARGAAGRGRPADFIEQNAQHDPAPRRPADRAHGKDVLPMAGEYTGGAVLHRRARQFVGTRQLLDSRRRQPAPRRRIAPAPQASRSTTRCTPRPPGFCTGCPERPIFTAMKLVERELGPHHVSADIGCHLFSILPPFNIGNTTMGYGLGAAGAARFNTPAGKRAISIMGDGGFWHNGLTSGIGNAVFNKSDNVTLSSTTATPPRPAGRTSCRRARQPHAQHRHPIEKAVRGVGVEVGEDITPHLRRRADARRAEGGADDARNRARRSSSRSPSAC